MPAFWAWMFIGVKQAIKATLVEKGVPPTLSGRSTYVGKG